MSPAAPPAPVLLDGFADIADRYDVLFCDVWGVLHNGVAAFPEAVDALTRFRAGGGTVILVSNAPRPSPVIRRQLHDLGAPPEVYDALVTSGDVTRTLLRERAGVALHHIGPARDLTTFEGLDLHLVEPARASLVVCTGLLDDRTEGPEDYRERLAELRAAAIPMICANPDLVVEAGDRLIYCAGALADLYARMGGEVTYSGKPYPAIYEAALLTAAEVRGATVPLWRVLAVGDALRTDLAGARGVGIDALFIALGIHADEVAGPDGPDLSRLSQVLSEGGADPVAAQWRLAW